jgi:hypothetical protein
MLTIDSQQLRDDIATLAQFVEPETVLPPIITITFPILKQPWVL